MNAIRKPRRSVQAPSSVVMIRPHSFRSNPETSEDNAFQKQGGEDTDGRIAKAAYKEVTAAAETLSQHGVTTHIFEDEGQATPDSVFPNNWFSTHPGGHVALYPMAMKNRRLERRSDVLELLKQHYRVQDIIDYSGLEADGMFLEGTGAMVLDHVDRVAYAARSKRTDPVALERFCTHFNYEPMVFDALDATGVAIYHTNVLMCIATDFALIGLDSISNRARRDEIVDRLSRSGREVMTLTHEQVANFAGNAIELQGADNRILALSSRASASLTDKQKAIIEQSCTLVPLEVPTIELAGGSVRCMLAGVHLVSR
ncbi:citrulline utilization hydrolase CtlX [Granulosicoccus antarcticus]|uniref:Amidinotransferase n=1 Tax=Granulosicoccus antarcticus IMCC3135 TaxID=1192854 RepID=A0A2Z2NRE9_9GAMM|nr:arginine deiminase-related protein [Granulosicoccus antarcticus]ASJ73075.1 hypothetical protein IMCC3135_14950 [Granulosicoccus antarcticus IMCC3135]